MKEQPPKSSTFSPQLTCLLNYLDLLLWKNDTKKKKKKVFMTWITMMV